MGKGLSINYSEGALGKNTEGHATGRLSLRALVVHEAEAPAARRGALLLVGVHQVDAVDARPEARRQRVRVLDATEEVALDERRLLVVVIRHVNVAGDLK